MAHTLQPGALRSARHTARRRLRALPITALALTLGAGAALAAPTDPGSWASETTDAVPETDLPAWWARAGGPGWTPEADAGSGFAWTFAGHVIGSWARSSESGAPLSLPWPAVPGARRPLVWSDSVTVTQPANGAWLGPEGSLALASSWHLPTTGARARSIFRLENGDFGASHYSLMFERGDSARWIRIETGAGNRDVGGALGRAGDHDWGVSGSWSRGPHRLSAAFDQSGAARSLSHAEVSEDASGRSGRLGYLWSRGPRRLSAKLSRGFDHREGAIDVGGIPFSYSRRDGDETHFELEGEAPLGKGVMAVRAQADRAHVVRSFDDAFDTRERLIWGAISYQIPTREGPVKFDLGGGRSSALESGMLAPALTFTFGDPRVSGRVFAERLVHPVWSDLAPGQAAFLQRTSVLGLEAGETRGALHAEASVVAGVTRDRAIVFPYPIEDIWLRAGLTAEGARYDFALLTAAVRVEGARLGAGVSGFALGRDQVATEPRVEPDVGLRAWLEGGFHAFQGDLGIRLRMETAAVGERSTKSLDEPIPLPPYWTSAASAIFTLAGVTVTMRMSNLENARRPESWIDPGTNLPALGTGRAFRFALSGRMLN